MSYKLSYESSTLMAIASNEFQSHLPMICLPRGVKNLGVRLHGFMHGGYELAMIQSVLCKSLHCTRLLRERIAGAMPMDTALCPGSPVCFI